MIYEINWNIDGQLPFGYISEVKFFKKNNKVEFKKGLNILVGDNGCGKSTLVNIIKYYFLEEHDNMPQFMTDEYDHLSLISRGDFPIDMNVVASYGTPTVSMNNPAEMKSTQRISLAVIEHRLSHGSQGENTMMEYTKCVDNLYYNNSAYRHPWSLIEHSLPKDWEALSSIKEYYRRNDRKDNISAMILDEPDNSISVTGILHFKNELDDFIKNCSEGMQIIAVLHNPILLIHFIDNPNVNFIEMSRGYINAIRKLKKSIVNK